MSELARLEEIAARWIIRSEEPGWSEVDQAEFDKWRGESLAHRTAYLRLLRAWRQADRIGSLGHSAAPAYRPFADRWSVRHWRPVALAASIAVAVMAGSYQLAGPITSRPAEQFAQRIETRVGGHTVVPLDDGSRIELNTSTSLRAAVTAASREVWLDRGEAYFEVNRSDKIPFVIHAGPRRITVLGTKFSVRYEADKVTIAVVEGRVKIDKDSSGNAPVSSTIVVAGDIAIARRESTIVASRSADQVESVLAWRDGMLTFKRAPLSEVVADFNRYNERKLAVADPEVASVRIGGTFRASDIDGFIKLLHEAYGIEAQANGSEIKISE